MNLMVMNNILSTNFSSYTKDLSKVAKDIINDCQTFCNDNDVLDKYIDEIAKVKINEVINNLN